MSVREWTDDDVAGADPVLDVQITFTPTLPMVRLAGELDLYSEHLLTDALQCVAAVPCPANLVVLDLSGVTFCDVAGLRAVEACAATLGGAGKELLLYHPSHPVTRLMEIRRRTTLKKLAARQPSIPVASCASPTGLLSGEPRWRR